MATQNSIDIGVVPGGGFTYTFPTGTGTLYSTLSGSITSAQLATSLTDETGSGAAVFGTSPTLVTPALGTPTALVATNATGTATGLTSGITNALKSATTTVDVSAATAPTAGQVLTATAGTTATWQTPTSIPSMYFSTIFETAGRFSVVGSATFNSNGAVITTGTSSISVPYAGGNVNNEFDGTPIASWSIQIGTTSGTNGIWTNIGGPLTAASTSVAKHIGFKVLDVAGTATLFATQADGTTENVSSAIFTTVTGDNLDLTCQVTATGVNYTAQKNGATKSTVTLTTNKPTGNSGTGIISLGTSSGSALGVTGLAMSYSR